MVLLLFAVRLEDHRRCEQKAAGTRMLLPLLSYPWLPVFTQMLVKALIGLQECMAWANHTLLSSYIVLPNNTQNTQNVQGE